MKTNRDKKPPETYAIIGAAIQVHSELGHGFLGYFDNIIVELKALGNLSKTKEAQLIDYLRAANIERGLLLNFGTTKLQYKRLVFNLRESASICG